jgi:hypothetical protein
VNIAGPGGKNAADKEIKEGDLFVIPKHYAAAKLAAKDDCLEFVAIATASMPKATFLAGANSVFDQIPPEVLYASKTDM